MNDKENMLRATHRFHGHLKWNELDSLETPRDIVDFLIKWQTIAQDMEREGRIVVVFSVPEKHAEDLGPDGLIQAVNNLIQQYESQLQRPPDPASPQQTDANPKSPRFVHYK